MELPIHLRNFSNKKRGLKEDVSYDTNHKIIGSYDDTTRLLFKALERCYNYFREHLFGNCLTEVVLVLNRHSRCAGYYLPAAWKSKEQHTAIPEINIHPVELQLQRMQIMQTIVHESCHHFQYLHGCPGKSGYHNKEFSHIMFSVGLMCSSTGQPGGQVTGRRMADYCIPGGMFEQVFENMPKELTIPFEMYGETMTTIPDPVKEAELMKKLKIKFTCPVCKANVWGKPSTDVACNKCKKIMVEIFKVKTKN